MSNQLGKIGARTNPGIRVRGYHLQSKDRDGHAFPREAGKDQSPSTALPPKGTCTSSQMAETDRFTEQPGVHGSLGQNTSENPSTKPKHLLVVMPSREKLGRINLLLEAFTTEQSRIHGSLGQNPCQNHAAKPKHLSPQMQPQSFPIKVWDETLDEIKDGQTVKVLSSSRTSITLCMDASMEGGGTQVGTHKMCGSWSQLETCLHINVLELEL